MADHSDEEPSPTAAPLIFISHHSSQHTAARQVRAHLAQSRIRCWLAPDDVDPGSAFDTQIIAALEQASAVVLLLDAEADRSRHVKREVMLAEDLGKPILPVRLAPIEAEGLAYWLKDCQWIDWFGGRGEGLERLAAALRTQVEAPQPAVLAPSAAARKRPWGLIGAGVTAGAIALVLAIWFGFGGGMAKEPYFRSGSWLNKREMIAITYPQLDAETTEQIRATIENDPNPEECISVQTAANPDVNLFDPGNEGKCTLSAFQLGSGRMSGYLTCPMVGVKDAIVSIAFRGTYTSDTIVVDQDVTMSQPSGTLKFKARESSHWIAENCAADNRE